MTHDADLVPQLPFDRPNALDVAPIYDLLRREAPIIRVRTPVGDPAWLVTRYEEMRNFFSDPRFGRSHPVPAEAAKISDAAILSGPAYDFDTEEIDHQRMRRLWVPAFSVKRMRLLGDHVQKVVDECLDNMEAAHDLAPAEPVDLHKHLSRLLPTIVVCELLGVPLEDHDYFRSLSVRIGVLDSGNDARDAIVELISPSDRIGVKDSGDDARDAIVELFMYMLRLAEAKRADPGRDVVSDLVLAQRSDPNVTDREVASAAMALMFAGQDSTMMRIDLGTLMLLTNPDKRNALAADPDGLVNSVVEEILRMAAPSLGMLRYAREDVQVGDQTIAKGDAVILANGIANRDPEAFSEPNRFDPSRPSNGHLAFGHGVYFCVGSNLARMELRAAFATMFRRFPTMRLAVGLDEIIMRGVAGGVSAVPVTW